VSYDVWVFASVSFAILLLRIVLDGWDQGGLFLHVWISVVGSVALHKLIARYGPRSLPVVRYAVLPLGMFVLIANVFFAAQIVFPFLALAALVAAAIPVWVEDRRVYVILVVLLSPLIVAWCVFYGVRRMVTIVRLRTLDPAEVTYVRFAPADGRQPPAMIRDPQRISAIVRALHDLTPYSPNHESIRDASAVEIVPRSGAPIRFSAGVSDRQESPTASWIEFGVDDYRSEALLRTLRESGGKPR